MQDKDMPSVKQLEDGKIGCPVDDSHYLIKCRDAALHNCAWCGVVYADKHELIADKLKG